MKLKLFSKVFPTNYDSTGQKPVFLFEEAVIEVPPGLSSIEAAKLIGKSTEHISIPELRKMAIYDEKSYTGYENFDVA